jgi:hypothetical protein
MSWSASTGFALVIAMLQTGVFASSRTIAVPNHGDLVLDLPDDWKDVPIYSSIPNRPPSGKFSDPTGRFEMLVIILSSKAGDVDFNSPQSVRQFAQDAGTRLLRDSKETSVEFSDLHGGEATGVFFTLRA